MKVYLIRHGQTDWNKQWKIQGRADIPLNENGLNMAIEVGEAVKDMQFDRIYSSPLNRAFTTAKLMTGKEETDIIVDDRVAEIDFGKGEGQNIKWIRKMPLCKMYNFFKRPEKYTPPKNGESFEALRKRSMDFFNNEIAPLENEIQSVAIFSHGAFIHETVSWIDNLDRKNYWSGPPLKNCTFTIFNLKDGKFTLVEEGKDMTL